MLLLLVGLMVMAQGIKATAVQKGHVKTDHGEKCFGWHCLLDPYHGPVVVQEACRIKHLSPGCQLVSQDDLPYPACCPICSSDVEDKGEIKTYKDWLPATRRKSFISQ